VLALAGRLTTPEDATGILNVWLDTPFEGGRHQRGSPRSSVLN
jgi:ribose 5-phosphate isomerase RpiB